VLLELPKWDFFMEGDDVLGIMRSSKAVTALTFTLEVMEGKLSKSLVRDVLAVLGEKGTEPCNLAIGCMDNPGRVRGWHADEQHRDRYPYDMTNWPSIFGTINLRAVPTMGLGLGALLLEGHDKRAGDWLERAVSSAQTYLGRHQPDGSYWEGLSYLDYAFRTLFVFLEAYNRVKGDVNWMEFANFRGVNSFIAAMQLGSQESNDRPDIVNFSDARDTTTVAVTSWLAKHTSDPLAQYNVKHFSRSSYFADFLWYDRDLPASPPPDSLKNTRMDLDWIVTRTGWNDEDAVLAFRSGKPSNHEHADRNALIYKIYGERLLTDHFGASYNRDEPHWMLRLTEAHNAVLVDGRGHHYVDGSEGTNAGKAAARILHYVDRDDIVWWVSDATSGYRLVTPDVTRVRRSVLFLKPDLIVMLDECESPDRDVRFAVRFHPDNRDNRAGLSTGKSSFTIRRPQATLRGWGHSDSPIDIIEGALDLPQSYGRFPYIEETTTPGRELEIVTVLHALPGPGDQKETGISIRRADESWEIQLPGRVVVINLKGEIPGFQV
ncbi:MAG: heparinase II/III-family protein, partial [Ignavibacteria bacterium]|nr:heparinase II/III-family protein [Ignavibacteria bacterium]